MTEYTVTFQPEGRQIRVPDCTTILEAATKAGVDIPNSCGGEGSCGKCKVLIQTGEVFSPPNPVLKDQERDAGYVLACEAMVQSDLVVECPMHLAQPEILVGRVDVGLDSYTVLEIPDRDTVDLPDWLVERVKQELEARNPDMPLVAALELHLPEPESDDNLDDLSRLHREIRKQFPTQNLDIPLDRLRYLGRLLRDSEWRVTAVVGEWNGVGHLLDLTAKSADDFYGLAIDVGTTTVVAHLLHLSGGKAVDVAACLNHQGAYGDDVIARILHAGTSDGLESLQHAIVGDLNTLIRELTQRQGIQETDIVATSAAGNATMTHLLLGVDPSHIRREPYVATANFMPVLEGREIGLNIHPNAPLYTSPGVASYVGGDTTAGVLASGMADRPELSLFIDIGTNGEIVLGNVEWLICCCCSCGPAFEGSGVRYGMRAAHGAIQRATIQLPQIVVETIGNVPPQGICGTGMIELLAEMLDAGILDRSGRFQPESCPSRFREGNDGVEFILFTSEANDGKQIVLTQADVHTLIRSKAAVYAGVASLVEQMGVAWEDIAHVYVAGGFGSHLDIVKAVEIGLLPDLPLDKYQFLGNSSVTGAVQQLLSSHARRHTTEIAKKMTYLELSANNLFMDQFMSAMFLPHTDLSRFPSVKRKASQS